MKTDQLSTNIYFRCRKREQEDGREKNLANRENLAIVINRKERENGIWSNITLN